MKFDRRTLGACLRDTAAAIPDKIAIEYAPSTSSYWSCTWKELDQVTDYLAIRFEKEWGIRKGTHVAIWSLNSPAYVQTYLALAKAGAVSCVINTAYKTEEMADVLSRSDAEVLFYEGGFRDCVFDNMIPEIRDLVPGVRYFVHMSGREAEQWLRPEDFSRREKDPQALAAFQAESAALEPESVLNMIFTSGTTSKPKGVELTHFGIVNMAIRLGKGMHWSDKDKAVIAASLYHGFGLNAGVGCSVVNKMSMHIVPSFRTKPVWDAIDRYKCTVMLGVPSMYLALVDKGDQADRSGDSLTSGLVGGAMLSLEEYERISARFANMKLISAFGMTEASTASTMCDWDNPCDGHVLTCGKFYENNYARIADLKTGEILCTNLLPGTEDPYLPEGTREAVWPSFEEGAGKAGELQLAGFSNFKDYYGMPEHTKECYTDDGWFKTGDVGCFTRDGDFIISGRIKSLIIRSGENISPREIEEAILSSGMVENVCVIGVPNPFTNEEIAACIEEKSDVPFDSKALMKYLSGKLSYFKMPKFLLLFDELPMTASGKVKLSALKERAAALTAGLSDFSVIEAR